MIFPSSNFPTVQFPKWQPSKFVLVSALVLTADLSPLAQPSRDAQPPLLPAVQPNLLEVASWEIAHLGNCHLGSHSKENALGKVPNTSS